MPIDAVTASEKNVYTMKSFAGVLCNQLIKYVDAHIASAALRTSRSLPTAQLASFPRTSNDGSSRLSRLKRTYVQSFDYLSEDDIIRLEDIYKRD